MRTAGLVLAAGAGTRFGGPKAPVRVGGERLVDRAVRNLCEAGVDPVLVVLGAWLGEVPGARVIVNPHWQAGMGSSLKAGLSVLSGHDFTDVEAVIVTLVDLPGLTSSAIQRVTEHPGEIVVASYDGERGHPVKFARSHWEGVAATAQADAGARAYLRQRADIALVEVGDVATRDDVDRPEDLPNGAST